MKTKNLKFWKRGIDIFKPCFLTKFLVEKNTKKLHSWGFWFLANGFFAIIFTGFSTFKIINLSAELYNKFDETVADDVSITLTNSELSINNLPPYIYDEKNVFIHIDTNENIDTDALENKEVGFVVNKNNLIIKDSNKIQIFNFQDLTQKNKQFTDFNLTKQDVENFITNNKTKFLASFVSILLIASFLFLSIFYLFIILLWSLVLFLIKLLLGHAYK